MLDILFAQLVKKGAAVSPISPGFLAPLDPGAAIAGEGVLPADPGEEMEARG
jgi:hypothetical protein